jgi:glycosyltransferase involved in cell wall biosynthesis
MQPWHLLTCEYPPAIGGVSEHSRVLAEAAAARGYDVHVWAPDGSPAPGRIHVHPSLGGFAPEDLARTGTALDAWTAPRRVVVQWVPHGYGRRGLNVAFSRWLRRRAAAGDAIDVIVHEPFIDFTGGSWRRPAGAVIQRFMTWNALKAAHRVWVTIPGWESRLQGVLPSGTTIAGVLPVSGTVPVVQDVARVAIRRAELLASCGRLVGCFGAAGGYALNALRSTVPAMLRRDPGVAFVSIGRGSDDVGRALADAAPDLSPRVNSTGELPLDSISVHLQSCDVLLQPYEDGVSGRRTTTISALEHGVPVATTRGWLSEPFWGGTDAVELAPAADPAFLAVAVARLLGSGRNAAARDAARALYLERFDPARTLAPLFVS